MAESSVERARMAKRLTSQHGVNHRRHLYLLLDDWSWGYSIREVDLEPPPDFIEVYRQIPAGEPLPTAVFHMEAPRGFALYFTAAFGSKIMSLHPEKDGLLTLDNRLVLEGLVSFYDVKMREVGYAPWPKGDLSCRIFFSGKDKLFALGDTSFQVLYSSELVPGGRCFALSWCELQKPPFHSILACSHAEHPDGLILVSVFKNFTPLTYSFPMAEGIVSEESEWKIYGHWMLPFVGRAHFDRSLNAWVGLTNDRAARGHICACKLLPLNPSNDVIMQQPTCKKSKEKLFSEEPDENHLGATLVYIGGRGKFCLVEGVYKYKDCAAARTCDFLQEEEDPQEEEDSQEVEDPQEEEDRLPSCNMFRVTTFSLKYDENGDLTVGDSCRVRYYRLPGDVSGSVMQNPPAFWM
ncbi:hypothetical protein ACP70R_006581 [Stipagrostis hirtigluma subsp. patula]